VRATGWLKLAGKRLIEPEVRYAAAGRPAIRALGTRRLLRSSLTGIRSL